MNVLRVSDVSSLEIGNAVQVGVVEPSGNFVAAPAIDDFSRDVYGFLGLPIDAISFEGLIQSIDFITARPRPFLLATSNVNFLVKSQTNVPFRESVLSSDLCLADGMPLIWLAKLMRLPIYERVAGADLFVKLKSQDRAERPLKVFLLGGPDGTAGRVSVKLNSDKCGLQCVGALNPGFGTIEQMSRPDIIDKINNSGADLLAIFFGAEKAQQWLVHNHDRLRPSIRAQFGATINFEAGTVRRAPSFLRNTGFEWLWRIKEEPYLWRRYWADGKALLKLLVTCALPLAIAARRRNGEATSFAIHSNEGPSSVTVWLSGSAVAKNVDETVRHFRAALAAYKHVHVDLANVDYIDSRFFGLLLMTRKRLANQGNKLVFTNVSPKARRMFKLNRFDYLLAP